jgi:hypothetical protein
MISHRRRDAPSQAPQVEFKTVKYRAAQEHLVRRLGEALVLHWDALPDDLQDLLIDQAAVIPDRDDGAHATGDIESFIRTVKVAAIPKPSTADAAEQ